MSTRLLMVVNDPAFFLSHRLPIALAALKAGYDVHVATMPGDACSKITDFGLIHHELPLTRSGSNPLKEIATFISIYRLFAKLRPDLVHLVTIKPVLYGGIAARLARVPGVVLAISGLGSVFIARGLKASFTKRFVKSLYRFVFSAKAIKVIFQNLDDRNSFVEGKFLAPNTTTLIHGSGVDLEKFQLRDEDVGTPVIVFAGRLLRDKGVREYCEAAHALKKQGVDARFLLAGTPDYGNPTSLSHEDLALIEEAGEVELLGHCEDIARLFSESNVIVLPSYREGLPKVLIEAAAAGRAIVTTDVPGCRDAIEPGVTGLLVNVKDSTSLAEAILKLIENDDLRLHMGKEGRRLAEERFSIEKVVQDHMDIYDELKGKKCSR